MGKMLLVTGWIVTYTYIVEAFMAWYSGNPYERYTMLVARPFGPFAIAFWVIILCNCVRPRSCGRGGCERARGFSSWSSLFIQLGMWIERFMIIVTSLHRDFLPSSWHSYTPTWVDWSILLGTIVFFLFLFLLFLRFVPFIPAWEVRELKGRLAREEEAAHA